MDQAPRLVDRALVRRRLARAEAAGFATFLVDRTGEELAERLGAVTRSFETVLDLGTPGKTAIDVLRRTGRADRIVRLAGTPNAAGAETVVGDEEFLPFGPGSFDLAVTLLALQSVNDLPGVLVQVRRALKPDGLLLGCMFGGGTLAEVRAAFTLAESEVEGGASPRVMPFADVRTLGALLQRAGFALPVVDLETVVVRYRDLFGLMADLRAMGLTNPLSDRLRRSLRRATLMRAASVYAERFADPDGRVRATFDLVWLSGWAPHESQPRPLRPGSAKARLADALGTVEHRVGREEPSP